jgi:hypothetical protein
LQLSILNEGMNLLKLGIGFRWNKVHRLFVHLVPNRLVTLLLFNTDCDSHCKCTRHEKSVNQA